MKIELRLSFVLIILPVVMCSCERHDFRRKLPEIEERPQKSQTSFQMPPRDYSVWLKEFGANEPDLATDEGRRRWRDERSRLDAAKVEFANILGDLGNVYTNSSERVFLEILSRIDEVLDGFSRENSASILCGVGENVGLICPSWDLFVSSELAVRASVRYATVAGRLADLTWIKCGEAFVAAEIDNATFRALKEIDRYCVRKGWGGAQNKVRTLIERNARDRCDSETSNFYRSHVLCERRYHTCFEKLVQEDPRLNKPLSHWYRRHLDCARSILGREPNWPLVNCHSDSSSVK